MVGREEERTEKCPFFFGSLQGTSRAFCGENVLGID